MSGLALVDSSFVSNAHRAGGADALQKLTEVAKGAGYNVSITDVVKRELQDGPAYKDSGVRAWVDSLPTVKTNTGIADAAYQAGVNNAFKLKDAGERSALEAANAAQKLGKPVAILSDDTKITSKSLPSMLKEAIGSDAAKASKLGSGNILNGAELAKIGQLNGTLSASEFSSLVQGYQRVPSVANSPKLNTFHQPLGDSLMAQGAKLSATLRESVADGVGSWKSLGVGALKYGGPIGAGFGLGLTVKDARAQSLAGDYDGAQNTLGRYVAGAFGGIVGSVIGTPLGMPIAGGVFGGLVGESLYDSDKTLPVMPYRDPFSPLYGDPISAMTPNLSANAATGVLAAKTGNSYMPPSAISAQQYGLAWSSPTQPEPNPGTHGTWGGPSGSPSKTGVGGLNGMGTVKNNPEMGGYHSRPQPSVGSHGTWGGPSGSGANSGTGKRLFSWLTFNSAWLEEGVSIITNGNRTTNGYLVDIAYIVLFF